MDIRFQLPNSSFVTLKIYNVVRRQNIFDTPIHFIIGFLCPFLTIYAYFNPNL